MSTMTHLAQPTATNRSPEHRTASFTKRNKFARLLSPNRRRNGPKVKSPAKVSNSSLDDDERPHSTPPPRQPSPLRPRENVDADLAGLQTPCRCKSSGPALIRSSPPAPPPPLPPLPPADVLGAAILGLKTSELGIGTSDGKHLSPSADFPKSRQSATRPSAAVQNVVDAQGSFAKSVRETIGTQEKLIKQRLATVSRKNDLRSQVSLYLAAHEDFAGVLTDVVSAVENLGLDPELKSRFRTAYDRSEQLSTTVKKWQRLLDGNEDLELLKSENRYLNQVDELSKHLKDFLPETINKDEYLAELAVEQSQTTHRPPSLFSSSSDSTNSLHQRYLRTIGTINLLRDRLFNWKADVYIEMDQRDQDREDGLQPELSEEQFFSKLEHRRQDIVDEYWAAKKEMAETYEACLEEGLEPEPANIPPHLDQLFSREDLANLKSGPGEYSYIQSHRARNVLQWAQHLDNIGQATTPPTILGISATGDFTFPDADERDDGWSTVGGSVRSENSSVRYPPSFPGEMPRDGRRYSAPMILRRTDQSKNTLALDYQGAKVRRLQARIRESKTELRRASSVHSRD